MVIQSKLKIVVNKSQEMFAWVILNLVNTLLP